MFRIVYTSRLDPAIGRAEIEAIVARAQARNKRDGITGAWLMRGRDCLSALEGPPKAVRETTERIWDDRRHSEFRLHEMKPTDDRHFEGWDLEFLDVDDQSLARIEAHPGLSWLCRFAGGAEAFVSQGLPSEPDPNS